MFVLFFLLFVRLPPLQNRSADSSRTIAVCVWLNWQRDLLTCHGRRENSPWAGPFLLYYLSIVNDFNVLAGPLRNSVSFQPKSVCKVRKNFRTDQTFSRNFCFFFLRRTSSPKVPDGLRRPFWAHRVAVFLKSECKVRHFLHSIQIFQQEIYAVKHSRTTNFLLTNKIQKYF